MRQLLIILALVALSGEAVISLATLNFNSTTQNYEHIDH